MRRYLDTLAKNKLNGTRLWAGAYAALSEAAHRVREHDVVFLEAAAKLTASCMRYTGAKSLAG